jgi:DNA-binding GntR family transcriptional regulator
MARPAKIVRIDLNDQVYESIKERLLSREWGPRARLSLQSLADELGVSRSPVHHAVTRLVSEGLVGVDRRGHYAVPVTAKLMSDAHDARLAIELFATERTAGQLAEPERAELRRLLADTVRHVDGRRFRDKRKYLFANQAFHEYLVDLAGNDVLSEMYRRLSVHRLMERALLGYPAVDAGNSSEEHTAIVESLERGELETARAAVRANAETGKRIALAAIEQAGGVL